jgi:hypothetical protein
VKGSEFVQAYTNKGIAAWEAAAVELARQGGLVAWPMVNLSLSSTSKDGSMHTATLPVSSDYLAVGEPGDSIRLPLRPSTAQTIANLSGMLLPTPKIAYEVWRQAQTQLVPSPQDNHGASLADYFKHQQKVDSQLAALPASPSGPGLVTGHKKDVVVSNIYKPGKVLIYGWFWPKDMTPPSGYSQPIQGRSNVHGDFYVDYSHGIRLVSPVMTVDGEERQTESVLRDPELSKLLSDEGPVRTLRYPASNDPAPYRPASKEEYRALNGVYPVPSTTSLADIGLGVLASRTR